MGIGGKRTDFLRMISFCFMLESLWHAQGLEVVMNAALRLKDTINIKFVIVGDGPRKESLLKIKNELNLSNVFFYNTVEKAEMIKIIHDVDAAIIPLKKLDLFKGAIPSKIFENLIMGKPIILGVDGEAKELFIEKGKCGLYYEPENNKDLADKIVKLYSSPELYKKISENAMNYVTNNFSREKIADDFINFILKN